MQELMCMNMYCSPKIAHHITYLYLMTLDLSLMQCNVSKLESQILKAILPFLPFTKIYT